MNRFLDYHFIFKSDLYIKSSLFHNAMMAKLSVSVDYFKEFYALAYSPVLAEMYRKASNDRNYPLSTFFETEIQSATIRCTRNVSDFLR